MVITYGLIPEGQAANTLLNREVKLSDSRPSTSATYDFEADHTNSAVKCINVQFCTTASGTCNTTGIGLTSAAKGTESDWSRWTYGNWSFATATDLIAYTNATGEAPSPTTDASFSVNTLTNPSTAATYYARIETTDATSNCNTSDPDGTTIDTGVVAFAIIQGVTVSVTVSETLSSAVYLVTSANCTITGGTSKITSTATTVPFGDILTENFYDICQSVHVATNALNYTTRVFKTASLTCSNSSRCDASTIADGSCDGGGSPCTTTAEQAWATNTNNGFAYCMDDISGNGAEEADAGWGSNGCGGGGTQSFKIIATNTASAVAIMNSTNAAVSDDQANIGYRLSVDTSQVAGPYSTTVVFTTTPTY